MSTTVYVTSQELASGLCRVTDEQDGTVYGEAVPPGDVDAIVKQAHNDWGAIVIITTKRLDED